MSKLIIEGAGPLCGEATVHGAKNGALPILAACLTIDGQTVIHNCADLADVRVSIKILEHFGCKVKREGRTLIINSENIVCSPIPETLMREMRSSIIFLGAVTARCGSAVMSAPGGCELGPRPIDLHIASLRLLGVDIKEEHGTINCLARELKGAKIYIPIPSVGTTENIMIAAVLAKGTTTICNAAREPEIVDLADFLNAAGAKISGAGTGDIVIEGVERLFGCEHTVLPDRILAATYMSAVAITGGNAIIHGVEPLHLRSTVSVYEELGCEIYYDSKDMKIAAPAKLNALKDVRTNYYPGFPTDAGPTFLATVSVADGTTVFVENIFENRFKFISELIRLGAEIKISGNTAVVYGNKKLSGAKVKCTDLRGGAALMVGAFAASGVTEIDNIHHIERGYELPEYNFSSLGAKIRRM